MDEENALPCNIQSISTNGEGLMTEPEDRSAEHILVIDDDERLRDLLQRFLF